MMRVTLMAALLALGAASAPAAAGRRTLDDLLEAARVAKGVSVAPAAGDAEFLRRVTLDLTGTIPTEQELRAFLKNPDRAAKIDELLASPRFAPFMAETWTLAVYGAQDGNDTQRSGILHYFRAAFEENRPYDRMVHGLLTAAGTNERSPGANFIGRYLQSAGAPEEIAVKVSRTFLGIRLGCARCHDHPFDRWLQEDFYQFAAFFKATTRRYIANGRFEIVDEPSLAKGPFVPRGEKKGYRPKFLNGAEPQTAALREEFALFVTSNRQFARAFANRLWVHCFGRGLVHPVDNFSSRNPTPLPEVMEHLADEAIRLKFDVKAVFRLITASKAYQRTSSRPEADPARERVFAVAAVRPLTPGQTCDALIRALQLESVMPKAQVAELREKYARHLLRNTLHEDMTSVFEYRESVADVMLRMTFDAREIRGKGLFAVKPSIETLYRTVLSRDPSARERTACEAFFKRGGTAEELVMTLLNSHEFAFNH